MKRRKSPRPLWVEALEQRAVLASLTVNTVADNFAADGLLSLREAIYTVNFGSSAYLDAGAIAQITGEFGPNDTIRFAAELAGSTITLGGTELSLQQSMTIDGAAAPGLTISGSNVLRIFNIDDLSPGAGITVNLANLTLRDGFADGGAIFNEENVNIFQVHVTNNITDLFGVGGGIYNNGTLTVTNSTLTGNSAVDGNGGGISNNGTLTVTNSTLTGNSAHSFGGGIDNNGTLTVTNSTLSENSAGFAGGGIYNTGTLMVNGSTLSGNSADSYGGGIDNNGTLTFTNSTLSENSADKYGGGICNYDTLTVTNSTLSGNSAGLFSGGIDNNGTLTITDSTLSENSSAAAGGIYNNGTLTITHSTLSGNSANNSGGGIFNDFGQVTIINSTLTNNRSDADGDNPASDIGGGIWTFDDSTTFTTLQNTIVAGNFIGTGTTPNDLAEKIVESTSSNNLIGDATTAGGLTNGSNGNLVGIAVATVLNPTLANNGGPTLTHALVINSPAINAGNNTTANNAGLTTDQRGLGFPRILGGIVDIGAVEQAFAPTAFTLTLNLTTPSSEQQLTIAINLTGSPIPTGTVTLYVNGVPGVPVSLIAGQMEVTLNGLPVGLHTIFARYSGDSNYAAADSAVLNQQVYQPSDLNRANNVDITDVLIAVFYFNTYVNQLPIAVASLPAGPPFVDASGDGLFDIKDLLRVVFDYNQSLANPEGEFAPLPLLSPDPSPFFATGAVFTDDVDWLWPELLTPKRRRA